jgi:hypothetical protein
MKGISVLNKLWKLAPYWLVEWLMVRYCERVNISETGYTVFDGITIVKKEK